MRKLFLASVTFKVGEVEHHEYRLVIADVDKSMKDSEQRELAVNIGFNQWLNEAVGTDRVILGLSVSSVLEQGNDASQSYPVVFNQAFGPGEFPKVDKVWSAESEETISVHVLIDIDGTKQYWDTGWYNYSEKRWENCNREFDTQISKNEFKWMYIP